MLSFILDLLKNAWDAMMSFLGFQSHPLQSSEFQVLVKTNVGEQVCISFNPSSSVKQIKSNVAAKLKSSEDSLRLIFAGKELPDNLSISECDIGNRSILHAVRVAPTDRKKKEPDKNPKDGAFEANLSVIKEGGDVSLTPISSELPVSEQTVEEQITSFSTVSNEDCDVNPRGQPYRRTRLLCDDSTVMTIQLSERELEQLRKIKKSVESNEKPHFYIYCSQPCSSIRVGKLRVRCSRCKEGALILHRDPANWKDVLRSNQIKASCETLGCGETYASFYFKCREHETSEDDSSVVLYLIRANLPGVSCLACTDVSSPVIVFQCASRHVMCLDCFVTYCVSRLNERQFISDFDIGYTLPCPLGCEGSLIREVHHFKLMGDQHYERYQRFGAEEALLAAGGVLCPQPGCGQGILADEECRRIVCIQGCNYVFCRDCLQGYHIGPCHLESGITHSSSLSSFSFDPNRAAQATWDEASNVAIRITTKPCPKCRTPTERSGGCMHMICTRAQCQYNWCWVCQTEWTRDCMAAHWFG